MVLPDDALVSVYQRMRDEGSLSADEAFFLLAEALERIADWREPERLPSLRWFSSRIDAMEKIYGLAPDEYLYVDEAPPEYRELNARYDRAWDAFTAETVREFDEMEIAELFIGDRAEYRRRCQRGRESLERRYGAVPKTSALRKYRSPLSVALAIALHSC